MTPRTPNLHGKPKSGKITSGDNPKIQYEMGEYKINLKSMCLRKRSTIVITITLKIHSHKSLKIVDNILVWMNDDEGDFE